MGRNTDRNEKWWRYFHSSWCAVGPWGTPTKIATNDGNTDEDENGGVIFIQLALDVGMGGSGTDERCRLVS